MQMKVSDVREAVRLEVERLEVWTLGRPGVPLSCCFPDVPTEAKLTAPGKLPTSWAGFLPRPCTALSRLTSPEHRAVVSDHTNSTPRPPSLALADTRLCSHRGLDAVPLTPHPSPTPLHCLCSSWRGGGVCWLQVDCPGVHLLHLPAPNLSEAVSSPGTWRW